jgi:hypothetical protein
VLSDKAREALEIVVRAAVREILSTPDEPIPVLPAPASPVPPPEASDVWVQPRFDFDPSTDDQFEPEQAEDPGLPPETELCNHGGVWYLKKDCIEHREQPAPSIAELDALHSDGGEFESSITRAQRKREAETAKRRHERLFPEEIPMRGLGPPDEDG